LAEVRRTAVNDTRSLNELIDVMNASLPMEGGEKEESNE
jgi:hypothetical protein